MTVYEILVKGGPVVALIGLCSVVGLAAFLERLWGLRSTRIAPSDLLARVEGLIRDKRNQEALTLCQADGSPLARIFQAALSHAGKPRDQIKEAVEEVGKLESAQFEKNVEVVGTVAAISPLLGLLGTVMGMITVFQRIEQAGLGDPSVFASGIWEALITTAVGLAVAIPAFIAYKFLFAKIDKLVIDLQERSLQAVDSLAKE